MATTESSRSHHQLNSSANHTVTAITLSCIPKAGTEPHCFPKRICFPVPEARHLHLAGYTGRKAWPYPGDRSWGEGVCGCSVGAGGSVWVLRSWGGKHMGAQLHPSSTPELVQPGELSGHVGPAEQAYTEIPNCPTAPEGRRGPSGL